MFGRYYIGDFPWGWEGFWEKHPYTWTTITYPHGTYVDADKFDLIDGKLVPRKSYQEKLLKDKEEEIEKFKVNSGNRLKELEAERDKLKAD